MGVYRCSLANCKNLNFFPLVNAVSCSFCFQGFQIVTREKKFGMRKNSKTNFWFIFLSFVLLLKVLVLAWSFESKFF